MSKSMSKSMSMSMSMSGGNIALCMICGNEEAVILKCLESAKEAFDSLFLVQATGEAASDETMPIAWRWCLENKKSFEFAVYHNRVPGLKHVDDFSEARNLCFAIAFAKGPQDWLLWLDCDDYLDDINCRRIREAVSTAPADWNGIRCRYRVQSEGAVISRERLIRPAGRPRWKNPVHETCMIEGKVGDCPQIEVFHSDHSAKHESSALRNLAILERVTEDAGRHHFYLHTDLKTVGRHDEAEQAGLAALALMAADQVEERYLVLLNLSELQPERRQDRLLEAAALQPHRREAFAHLCQLGLIEGRARDAISWFRIMDALPLPEPVPWTHQCMWYGGPTIAGGDLKVGLRAGWARYFLRVRVLRASGNAGQAELEHAENLKEPRYRKGVEQYEQVRK